MRGQQWMTPLDIRTKPPIMTGTRRFMIRRASLLEPNLISESCPERGMLWWVTWQRLLSLFFLGTTYTPTRLWFPWVYSATYTLASMMNVVAWGQIGLPKGRPEGIIVSRYPFSVSARNMRKVLYYLRRRSRSGKIGRFSRMNLTLQDLPAHDLSPSQ